MSQLTDYHFDGHRVRTAGTPDSPLFCLADVCRALGVGNPSQVASRLDDDQKGICQVDTPRRSPADGVP